MCAPHSMGTSGCIICRLVMDDFRVLNTYLALCGRTIMSLAINKGVPARMSTSRSSTTRAEVSFAGYG